MAASYTDLKTEIAEFYNRSDMTAVVDTFIDLCESEMQVECKTLELEVTATVTMTAGEATLPSDWLGGRSVVLLSNPQRPLSYLPPERIAHYNARDPSYVNYYTVTGSVLKFADDGDGDVLLTYNAKFVPLSGSNASNAILANFPGAYLWGSMKQAAIWAKDFTAAVGYDTQFKAQLALINANNNDRKYAGPLAVRPA